MKRDFTHATDCPVLIKPKQHTDSSVTKTDITNLVDPSDLGIGITRFRKTKDGQMIVAVQTEQELLALRQHMTNNRQFSSHYEVRTPNKRRPRVILLSVPKAYSDVRKWLRQFIYKIWPSKRHSRLCLVSEPNSNSFSTLKRLRRETIP